MRNFEKLEARQLLTSVLFEEDFSSGISPDLSLQSSSEYGRIEVVNGALRMDSSSNGNYVRNSATVRLDLTNYENVKIEFDHKSLNDETTASDGVFVQWNSQWRRIWAPGQQFELDLDAIAVAQGGHYDSNVGIRFQQYDNYGAPDDGREWDNIRITGDLVEPSPEWPEGLGFHKDILLHAGVSLGNYGRAGARMLDATWDTLSTSSPSVQNSVLGGSPDDLNGALVYPDGQPRYRMIYVNGGNGPAHASSLNEAARSAVEEFFESGGSYVGSCLGAWFAGDLGITYRIIPYTYFTSEAPWGSSFNASFDGTPMEDALAELGYGPNVYNIAMFGGPIYRPGVDALYDIDGLEYWGNSSFGHPIASYNHPWTGRAVLSNGHPEYASAGTQTAMVAAMYQLAMDDGQQIPDLKADLRLGQVQRMFGAQQKVGDNQYHRYTVDMSGSNGKAIVRLRKLTENADIYVNCDQPANEQDHIKSSTNVGTSGENIRVACSGTLHVSVHGVHSTRNGAAYQLRVLEQSSAPALAPVIAGTAHDWGSTPRDEEAGPALS